MVRVTSDTFNRTRHESFNLYQKYQTTIHHDPPDDIDEFVDFLCKSPLQVRAIYYLQYSRYKLANSTIFTRFVLMPHSKFCVSFLSQTLFVSLSMSVYLTRNNVCLSFAVIFLRFIISRLLFGNDQFDQFIHDFLLLCSTSRLRMDHHADMDRFINNIGSTIVLLQWVSSIYYRNVSVPFISFTIRTSLFSHLAPTVH